MFDLASWLSIVYPDQGSLRESSLGLLEAMQDPQRGFPQMAYLKFEMAIGSSYSAKFIGGSAGAATRAINATFTESGGSAREYLFPYRACGGKMNIDRNQLAGPRAQYIKAGLLAGKARDIGGRLNNMWFKGDKTDSGNAQFQGVNKFCSDGTVLRIIDPAVQGGSLISVALMEQLLAFVPGANMIYCNRDQALQISNLNPLGFNRMVSFDAGPARPIAYQYNYKGIPIQPIDNYLDENSGNVTPILPYTDAYTPGGGTQTTNTTRVTACRLGVDGVKGAMHDVFHADPEVLFEEFLKNHLNWMAAPFVCDDLYSVGQIIGIKKS